jgi:phospholipid/cholesterol/gamma-HCH transport system ATP-binding protein
MEHESASPSSAAPPPIVRVEDLEKSFGRLRVLRGVTLSFPTGKTTVVLGPSGCGKSVMLKHLIGLLRPDKGRIYFEDQRVDTLGERALAELRRKFGFLFQHGALFDSMTIARTSPSRSGRRKASRRTTRRAACGTCSTSSASPTSTTGTRRSFSGGQQKRIALARAVILKPKVMLYDEPTTGLDPIRSDVIDELIIKMKQKFHFTSIVVTHDLASAFKVADHMVMFHEERLFMEGSPDDFRNSTDPLVCRFLKGEASEEELRAIRRLDATRVQPSEHLDERTGSQCPGRRLHDGRACGGSHPAVPLRRARLARRAELALAGAPALRAGTARGEPRHHARRARRAH